jgi:hypothetical protein
MKTAMRFFGALALLMWGIAFASGPGIAVSTGTRFEFTNCAAGGSASQNVVGPLDYLFRVTDEDVFVCWAATCAANGERFPVGFAAKLHFEGASTTLSCRSAGATGDAIFTRAD